MKFVLFIAIAMGLMSTAIGCELKAERVLVPVAWT